MKKRRLGWLWLTLAVVLADRATKAVFEVYTAADFHRELIRNFVYLVHNRNPGIAFGLLAESAVPWVRVAIMLGQFVMMAALAWLLVAGPAGGRMAHGGLALILGGAAGNWIDRLLHGSVTDFFEVLIGSYHWPAFNLADSAITVGAALVIVELLFGSRHISEGTSKQRTE